MLYQLAPTSLFDVFEEVERAFSDLGPPEWRMRRGAFPAVNVQTNEKEAVVSAELPGMKQEEIEISTLGDTLTIRGNRCLDIQGQGEQLRRERSCSAFTRTLTLPFPVAADSATATYRNGVLTIRLQRPIEHQPRRIAIA